MQESLLQQGVELMIYGMGTVFVFLAILVFITTLMSTLIQRFFPEKEAPVVPTTQAPVASQKDEQLVAVISAAVHKYRSRHK